MRYPELRFYFESLQAWIVLIQLSGVKGGLDLKELRPLCISGYCYTGCVAMYWSLAGLGSTTYSKYLMAPVTGYHIFSRNLTIFHTLSKSTTKCIRISCSPRPIVCIVFVHLANYLQSETCHLRCTCIQSPNISTQKLIANDGFYNNLDTFLDV
jgi:hypothetical protein